MFLPLLKLVIDGNELRDAELTNPEDCPSSTIALVIKPLLFPEIGDTSTGDDEGLYVKFDDEVDVFDPFGGLIDICGENVVDVGENVYEFVFDPINPSDIALLGIGDLVIEDALDGRRAVVTDGNGGNEFECVLPKIGVDNVGAVELDDPCSSIIIGEDITSSFEFSTL